MKRYSIVSGGLLGFFTALVVVAINYLGSYFANLPRASFTLFDWLARNLPGNLITLGIDSIVMVINRLGLGPTSAAAKLIEQGTAILIFLVIGAVFGMILTALGRRNPTRIVTYGQIGGLLMAASLILILYSLTFPPAGPVASSLWILLVFVLWGSVLAALIRSLFLPQSESQGAISRKEFLYLVGIGSFTLLVTAAGVSLLSRRETSGQTASVPNTGQLLNPEATSGGAPSPSMEELDARFPPVPGTRMEITPNEEFYRIDINTLPPEIDGESWRLELGGLVDNPLSLSLDDLRSRPAVNQAITLECISNQLGGDLISSSIWTGVQLKKILEEAGLQDGAQEVYIESVDGFYESVPMDEALDDRTLLVYEMNGEPLPIKHGFPLRIYIPNHFGMKQPKWITRMEVINYEGPGYWVDRGWSDSAIPPTTSVIDTVSIDGWNQKAGTLPIGGIAYAGARGISKVEVKVDDGEWQEVELRTPPLSSLTWVQWRYEWQAVAGRHNFQVRAYDGTGELQETAPSPPHPDGATGIDSMSATTPG